MLVRTEYVLLSGLKQNAEPNPILLFLQGQRLYGQGGGLGAAITPAGNNEIGNSYFRGMILPTLFIAPSTLGGRGVYTSEDIPAGAIVEIAPVIVMKKQDRVYLDQTLLHDYIFEWGDDKSACCMALGYVPVYNHSYTSNCEYEMDFDLEQISIKAIQLIRPGEELLINYNGNWNDNKKVWFDAK